MVQLHSELVTHQRHARTLRNMLSYEFCQSFNGKVRQMNRLDIVESRIRDQISQYHHFHASQHFLSKIRNDLPKKIPFLVSGTVLVFWVLISFSNIFGFLRGPRVSQNLLLFFKYDPKSLVCYLSVSLLTLLYLFKTYNRMKRKFAPVMTRRRYKISHCVESITFYVFLNITRLNFSEYTYFYEYDFLDLFSELSLLLIFLFLTEPFRPIEVFWHNVLLHY